MSDPSDTPPQAAPFRDAERWLADRGVVRDPIQLPDPESQAGPPGGDADHGRAPVTPREAARLATELPPPAGPPEGDLPPAPPALEDAVAGAVAYIRRSTAQAPQAEGRLRDKLQARGEPAVVIERALARARAEGLVDDAAFAASLVDEGRRKGHAPLRIRTDLIRRGLGRDVIDAALARFEQEDPEAQAFELAARKAAASRGVSAETAFRRVVGHLARRGYPEALARKVAREAVYADREAERSAGH